MRLVGGGWQFTMYGRRNQSYGLAWTNPKYNLFQNWPYMLSYIVVLWDRLWWSATLVWHNESEWQCNQRRHRYQNPNTIHWHMIIIEYCLTFVDNVWVDCVRAVTSSVFEDIYNKSVAASPSNGQATILPDLPITSATVIFRRRKVWNACMLRMADLWAIRW